MKLNKILVIALAALTFTACSDDNDASDYPGFLGGVNTESGVTVDMEDATFSAGENESPFYIPVVVNGERNGKVVVNVEVKEITDGPDTEPAKEVEHYNITSKSINIPAEDNTGFIEVCPVWEQGVINDDRVFEITITSAQGATVGNLATCKVTIENSDNPYTMMCGNWVLTGVDRDGAEVRYNIKLNTPSASSEDYGSFLYGFGIFGESDYLLPLMDFQYDEVTGKGTMKIGIGQMMTDGLAFNYGDPVGVCFPVCAARTAGGITMNAEYVCEFDSNFNTITIPEDATIVGALFSNSTGQYTGYTVGQIGSMKMSR